MSEIEEDFDATKLSDSAYADLMETMSNEWQPIIKFKEESK